MIQFLHFKLFDNTAGLVHFITTREGGNSEGLYRSLNLSLNSGDKEENVISNRLKLAGQMMIKPDQMLFPDQCHTAELKCIQRTHKFLDLSETDGLITDQNDLCLCVLAADCVPVLLYDQRKKIIAAVHAGWKGTVKQIVPGAIDKMRWQYGSEPGDILAGVGPAISPERYEVGQEVGSEVKNLFQDSQGIIFHNHESHRDHIDLQEANRKLLLRCGLQRENIEIMRTCTYSNPGLFFSARRDGYHSGRFASGIILRNTK